MTCNVFGWKLNPTLLLSYFMTTCILYTVNDQQTTVNAVGITTED